MSARLVRLTPAFELEFHQNILEGLAVVGKYDGKNPSLTCATGGGRVFVHSPHERPAPGAPPGSELKYLNINRQPTALSAGRLDSKKEQDVLMVGTQTSLLAYNVNGNSDLFYREVPDGINTMCFGSVAQTNSNLVVVGGNCSIQGFNESGDERFWTVTGDNVTALALMPWGDVQGQQASSRNALLVGSEDNEIRVFHNEDVVCEVTESDAVVALVPLGPSQVNKFIYALGNGTVGVYEGQKRVWRFKSKYRVNSVTTCDVDFDGVPEVLIGWSNGKFEVRSDASGSGERIFQETYSHPVSSVLHADYRQEGRDSAIVCMQDGTVRGYVALETSMQEAMEQHEQELLDKIMSEKQSLQYELTNFDDQLNKQRTGQQDASLPHHGTKLTCKLKPKRATKSVELVLTSSSGVIRSAIVSAENLFGGNESLFVYAEDAKDSLPVSLAPQRDVSTEIKIQSCVGQPMGETFQLHELTFKLPKFGMYMPVKGFEHDPTGSVQVRVAERMSRFQMWISSSFNVPPLKDDKATTLTLNFVSLRTDQQLQLVVTTEGGGQVTVKSDDMDAAGEVVQDLGSYLGLNELASVADFPTELDELRRTITKVEEYSAVRMKLTGEMADSSQLVKALVIKAEDARILCDMKNMRKMYGNLFDANRELIGEYLKRTNNHNELIVALKDVNAMIQKGAKLRIGAPKNKVIQECRAAIKDHNYQALFQIIRHGGST